MKCRVIYLALLLIFLTINKTHAIASADASGCIDTHQQEKKFFFKNTCDVTVTVLYCSTDKGIKNKFCGYDELFYTHMKTYAPYQESDVWDRGNIKYTACYGKISKSKLDKLFSANSIGTGHCYTLADSKLSQFNCGNTTIDYYVEDITPGTITYRFTNGEKLQLRAKRKKVNGKRIKQFNISEFTKHACGDNKPPEKSYMQLLKTFTHKSVEYCKKQSNDITNSGSDNKACSFPKMSMGERG